MEYLGIIGIFVGIIAIIFLSVKNFNIMVAAPLATLIVILTNHMDIFASLIGKEKSYMSGLANYLISNFAIFLLGAILAQYMEKSNATISIANFVLKMVGKNNAFVVLLAFVLIAGILTYGGISIYVVVFALVPLAKPLFKELDINWAILSTPLFIGISTVTLTMIPGTPSIHNAIPVKALGTTLTAAPMLSLIGIVVSLTFCIFYLYFDLKKSKAKGEGFYSYSKGEEQRLLDEQNSNPSATHATNEAVMPVWLAILPLVVLIAVIMLFTTVANIILIALTVAILVAAVLFRKNLPDQRILLNAGANSAVTSAFATSSSVAFGSVLTTAPAFSFIQSAIASIPGSPLIGLTITTAVLSAITGSASGAIGIVMANIAPSYVAMGLNPELVHRIAVVACAALTVVPHAGVVITFNTIAGVTLKDSFKRQFIVVNISHILAVAVMIMCSGFFY